MGKSCNFAQDQRVALGVLDLVQHLLSNRPWADNRSCAAPIAYKCARLEGYDWLQFVIRSQIAERRIVAKHKFNHHMPSYLHSISADAHCQERTDKNRFFFPL